MLCTRIRTLMFPYYTLICRILYRVVLSLPCQENGDIVVIGVVVVFRVDGILPFTKTVE